MATSHPSLGQRTHHRTEFPPNVRHPQTASAHSTKTGLRLLTQGYECFTLGSVAGAACSPSSSLQHASHMLAGERSCPGLGFSRVTCLRAHRTALPWHSAKRQREGRRLPRRDHGVAGHDQRQPTPTNGQLMLTANAAEPPPCPHPQRRCTGMWTWRSPRGSLRWTRKLLAAVVLGPVVG